MHLREKKPMTLLPFRFDCSEVRQLRSMTAAERADWYPPVSINPPIAEVRNDRVYKEIRGKPIDFDDGLAQLPHAEFFKMYFGWLGSAEVNFGINRDEFDIAHRALLETIRYLDLQGDLESACNKLYEDLNAIASLRGPRDYVFTVRDDTGRMWLQLKPGVYISELWEAPNRISSTFQLIIHDDDDEDQLGAGITIPRQCTYLFRCGELLGTSNVRVQLEPQLTERFFARALISDCHVELGDDNQPIAVFISVARHFLRNTVRFELERLAAFAGKFPLEGVARVKGRPWSLYELFAEMVVSRMLTENNIDSVSDRCAQLARTWLQYHHNQYQHTNLSEAHGNDVPKERLGSLRQLPDLVSVLDMHFMLGHAVAPNRHIGAIVLALFRGAMRSIKTSTVPGIARASVASSTGLSENEMIRQSGGKCRVRAHRKWKEGYVTFIGMSLIIAAAVAMWTLEGKAEAVAMGVSAVPFGIAVLSVAVKVLHDRDLNDWISGYETVTRLTEIKRDFSGDWRKVLLEPSAESKFAPVNACLFAADLRGTIVVDDPFSVADIESMGYEFGIEDSGHVGLRAPSGRFRRVELIENGLHITKEVCTGRMWTFSARSTPLASRVITCPSARQGWGVNYEYESGLRE